MKEITDRCYIKRSSKKQNIIETKSGKFSFFTEQYDLALYASTSTTLILSEKQLCNRTLVSPGKNNKDQSFDCCLPSIVVNYTNTNAEKRSQLRTRWSTRAKISCLAAEARMKGAIIKALGTKQKRGGGRHAAAR